LLENRFYNRRLLIERAKQIISREDKVRAGLASGESRKSKTLCGGTAFEQRSNSVGTQKEHTEEEREKERAVKGAGNSLREEGTKVNLPEYRSDEFIGDAKIGIENV